MALADLVVVMNAGRIEQAAHPREVFNRPATAFVARFMGDHNVIAGRAVSTADGATQFEVPGGAGFVAPAAAAEGAPVSIAVRTDKIRLAEGEPGFGFTGLVSAVEYRGSTVQVAVAAPGIEDFSVSVDEADFFRAPLAPGDAVPLSWSRDTVHVLA